MKATVSNNDALMFAIKVAACLSALDAIAIGPIPATWISNVLPIFATVVLRAEFRAVPTSLYFLLAWAFLIQVWALLCGAVGVCYQYQMPSLSTTPYPVFIALRFLPLAMVISTLAIMGALQDRQNELFKFVVRLGTWISAIALYVYVAQLVGLPDIPRTRLGTDGMEVTNVSFSYAFHRATGTFREPSGMAVWLILPFFLSFRSPSWRTYLMGAAIMLSGSMTSYVAVFGGATISTVFLFAKSTQRKIWLLRLPIIAGLVVIFAYLTFGLLVHTNSGFTSLWAVISDRLMPVVSGGIQESNRGYVFDFVGDIGVPFAGYGLGNINLMLTKWNGGDAVAGILSLYLNILMGLGVVGLLILCVFLATPLFRDFSDTPTKEAYPIFAAYYGWLVAFIIHSAEFPLMFALSFGLLAGARTARKS